jgi:hypothetical protein
MAEAREVHAAQQEAGSEAATGPGLEDRAVGMLWTWNGQWGCEPDVLAVLQAARSPLLRPEGFGDLGEAQQHSHLEEVAACVAALPAVKQLGQELWEEAQATAELHAWAGVSVSLELSTHAAEAGRVHLHAFGHLKATQRQRTAALTECLRFRRLRAPFAVPTLPGRGAGARARAVGQGHFYLQAAKLGTVFQATNFFQITHYCVRSEWAMAMWRQRKLSYAGCRAELVRARDRAWRYLQELDKQEKAEHTLRCQVDEARAAREQPLRPFKPAVAAELEWLGQYARSRGGAPSLHTVPAASLPPAPPLRRFKTLVYDGPSRTGKTERACHWWGSERSLVVNAQDCLTPNLREFLSGRYETIIFDEGNWELLWRNRALLQASARPVCLSQSQCNESAYSVQVFGIPMVVTSNDFWAGCKDPTAKDWVTKNTCYVAVAGPTWA